MHGEEHRSLVHVDDEVAITVGLIDSWTCDGDHEIFSGQLAGCHNNHLSRHSMASVAQLVHKREQVRTDVLERASTASPVHVNSHLVMAVDVTELRKLVHPTRKTRGRNANFIGNFVH